jgi:hypothetical protein
LRIACVNGMFVGIVYRRSAARESFGVVWCRGVVVEREHEGGEVDVERGRGA